MKINIAWCENDYQLDISLKEDRETYKVRLRVRVKWVYTVRVRVKWVS